MAFWSTPHRFVVAAEILARVSLFHTLAAPSPGSPFPARAQMLQHICHTLGSHLSHTNLPVLSTVAVRDQAGLAEAGGGTVTPIPSKPCHPKGLVLVLTPKGSPENDPEQLSLER